MKYDFTGDRRRDDTRRTDRDRPTDRDTRDTSGGWRDEYRVQDVPLPRTDGGGRSLGESEGDTADKDTTDERRAYVLPAPGTRVRDRDGDAGDELLVLDTHDVRADEYTIEATGRTVADHNPEYPGWVPVVEAVYVSDLDATTSYRSVDELRDAVEAGDLRAYTFPAPRLGTLPDDVAAEDGGEAE